MFHHDFGTDSNNKEVISVDVGVKIDAISWSPCHNFVLLGLNNGQSQLVHLPTKVPLPAVPILCFNKCKSERLENSTSIPSNSFVACWFEESEETNVVSLLLLSVHGTVSQYLI